MANVVVVHHRCHNGMDGSIHDRPKQAYRNGWLVKSHDDPAVVPWLLPDGRRVLLGDTYTEILDTPTRQV